MAVNIKRDFGNRRGTDINTLVYGKVPPQVPQLEEAVLGAIILEKDCFEDVMAIIPKDECFYVDANQKVYAALIRLNLKGLPIDLLTVIEELRGSGELEIVGGQYYLAKMISGIVSSAHVESHSRIIMEKYIQRELIRISGQTISESYEDSADVFDLLGRHEYDINALNEVGDSETMEHIHVSIREVLQDMEDLQNGTKKYMGIDTGIYQLTHLTKGWQNTDLIILAARPSQGKTALCLQFLIEAAISGTGVAIFSLEMGKKQLNQRLIANHSGIELEKIKTGNLNTTEQQKVNKSAEFIAGLPIYIDDKASNTAQRICNKIKSHKRKGKIGMAIIDYLQLCTVNDAKGKNREQQIAEMSRTLKTCAKDLEIPIIALSQMNRSIDASPRKPQLSDLRESGAIEQDADIVIFIHHEQGKTWLCVRKHRNGQTDEIEVVFLGAIQKFIDPNEIKEFEHYKSFSEGIRNAGQSIFGNETTF